MKSASLLYHDVVQPGRYEASGFQGAGPDRYKLEADEFEEHLSALAERIGYAPSAVGELGGEKSRLPWLLTFDDGGASSLQHWRDTGREGVVRTFLRDLRLHRVEADSSRPRTYARWRAWAT